jgi:hypothetical protein
MVSYTKMFHIFITKQVSGWCGSNSNIKLSLWNNDVDKVCPNCGLVNEISKHMTHRRHKGRVTLFHESLIDVTNCLECAHVDIDLVSVIEPLSTIVHCRRSCRRHHCHSPPSSNAAATAAIVVQGTVPH